MSSWVKVTRGQPQKPVNKKKPSGIPRLLDINPYKPSPKISVSDLFPRDVEDQSSYEELFGKKHNYTAGPEEYCERYQFSQDATQYNSDDRREKLYLKFYQQIQDEYHKERPSDCVVVAISKEQMEYATVIGHRLQDHGLVVEMIHLTSENGLTRALQEVKNDGSPFCILVEQSNVTLSSCTAIILHESIKIHRNMPMEDALALIVKAFGKIFGEREQQERNEISHKAADLADDYLERELYGSYTVPLDIRHLIFLLSDGKYLYAEELNAISDHVKTRITELEGYEEADTTEQANPVYESHSSSKTHLLEKPPPLLPTPPRNSFAIQAKPSLLGDRPTGGLLPLPGFKKADLKEESVNASFTSLPGGSSDGLAKPPPLLPTPVRAPLMAIGKPSLLLEKSSAGLLPTPGLPVGFHPCLTIPEADDPSRASLPDHSSNRSAWPTIATANHPITIARPNAPSLYPRCPQQASWTNPAGLTASKGKPPPLLAMPTMPAKRPPLLAFPPLSPAKRPLLGEKPGLLPTPGNTSHLWPAKPKPLLK